MIINDLIYGRFEVNEPVLVELLNSNALHRLMQISSAGFHPAYPEIMCDAMNRYHHSVGVFLLLRKFGAPLEEQIFGLIHDVSHSAFSHTIDYIEFDKDNQKSQGTQDENHEKIIRQSEIPSIFKRHGISLEYIMDDRNFSLAENELPDICADRLDYFFRQAVQVFSIVNEEEKDFLLENLSIRTDQGVRQFVFRNFEAASLYAEAFWALDEEHWSGLKSAVMFGVSGRMINCAINRRYIKKEDLFRLSDNEIINIIKQEMPRDEELRYYMELLHRPACEFENRPHGALAHLFCKSRKVNPLYIASDGSLYRVSDADPFFKSKFEKNAGYKEYYVKAPLKTFFSTGGKIFQPAC